MQTTTTNLDTARATVRELELEESARRARAAAEVMTRYRWAADRMLAGEPRPADASDELGEPEEFAAYQAARRELSSAAKLVAIYIGMRARGYVTPEGASVFSLPSSCVGALVTHGSTLTTIAAATGQSDPKHTGVYVRALVRAGHLVAHRRRGYSTVYVLAIAGVPITRFAESDEPNDPNGARRGELIHMSDWRVR